MIIISQTKITRLHRLQSNHLSPVQLSISFQLEENKGQIGGERW